MKRRKILLLLPLAGLVLSGCSFQDVMDWFKNLFNGGESAPSKTYKIQPKITGGTAEEKEAILKAVNSKPICYTSSNPRTTIYIDRGFNLKEDDGHNVFLVRKQTIKSKVVNIEWSVPEDQEYFGKITPVDNIKDLLEINYQGYQHDEGTLQWAIKKISCGGASAVNDKSLVYNAKVFNATYNHYNVKIGDIYEHNEVDAKIVNIGTKQYRFPSTLSLIDYKEDTAESASYSPYFRTNNPGTEKEYYYVNVKGKLIYTAPDGNWGLIANGTDVMEIYAGAGTKIKAENFPAIGTSEYISVTGNVSQYKGNVQISFITKIQSAEASEVDPVPDNLYTALTDADLEGLKNPASEGYDSDNQFALGIPNSLCSVTGKVKLDSLKDEEGKPIQKSELTDARFTFEIETDGGNRVIVAYDYHIHRETDTNLYEEFVSKLVDNAKVTVKGTMRYSGADKSPFNSLLYHTVVYKDDDPEVVKDAKTAEEYFNKAIKDGIKHFLRSGDDFTETTVWDKNATYYIREDLNAGARWNIIPFASGHISSVK